LVKSEYNFAPLQSFFSLLNESKLFGSDFCVAGDFFPGVCGERCFWGGVCGGRFGLLSKISGLVVEKHPTRICVHGLAHPPFCFWRCTNICTKALITAVSVVRLKQLSREIQKIRCA